MGAGNYHTPPVVPGLYLERKVRYHRPMSSPVGPVAFRLKRPYATDTEFVEGDGVGIFKSGMVLVGAGTRPEGVIVRFEVALRDGTPLFRGEGKVVRHRPHPEGDVPAGLEIKFTRLDGQGKALVDRALKLRLATQTPQPIPELSHDADLTLRVPSAVEPIPEAIPSPSDPHIVLADILPTGAAAVPLDRTVIAPPVELVEAGVIASVAGDSPPLLAQLRLRKVTIVERPGARDELLSRLRARSGHGGAAS